MLPITVLLWTTTITYNHYNPQKKIEVCLFAITRLKRAGVRTERLTLFYKARILTTLSYAAPSWYPFLSYPYKQRLERDQKLHVCLRLIHPKLDNSDERLAHQRLNELTVSLDIACLRYIEKIRGNECHPLFSYIPTITTGKNLLEGLHRWKNHRRQWKNHRKQAKPISRSAC